jgi:5-methylcytosine-specific restriction endonuclease McrA
MGTQIQKKTKTPETLKTFLESCITARSKPKLFQNMTLLGLKAEEAKPLFQEAKEVLKQKQNENPEPNPNPKQKPQTGGTVQTPFGPLTINVTLPGFPNVSSSPIPVNNSRLQQQRQQQRQRRKETIPKSLKEQIWYKYVGNNRTEAPCPCCRSETIKIMHFHAGHVISEANGGPTTLENLRPICGRCNLQMGSMNMPEYVWRFYGRRI